MMGRVFSLDIAVGNLMIIMSLMLTGILGTYYQASFLLLVYGAITLVLCSISIVYVKYTSLK